MCGVGGRSRRLAYPQPVSRTSGTLAMTLPGGVKRRRSATTLLESFLQRGRRPWQAPNGKGQWGAALQKERGQFSFQPLPWGQWGEGDACLPGFSPPPSVPRGCQFARLLRPKWFSGSWRAPLLMCGAGIGHLLKVRPEGSNTRKLGGCQSTAPNPLWHIDSVREEALRWVPSPYLRLLVRTAWSAPVVSWGCLLPARASPQI